MPTTLAELIALLARATGPSEIFGPLGDELAVTLRRRYRELALLAHPDMHPAQADEAHAAFTSLQRWYAVALDQLAQGLYGATPQLVITSARRRYVSSGQPLGGDLCDLYPTQADGAPALLKIARAPRNNDLLAAEARALAALDHALAGQPLRAHLPTLIESFLLQDASGARRHVNVLRREADTLSLAEVIRRLPGGLAAADAAWVFNRILAALGVTHAQGLVHGAVLPEHVLIRPSDHNGVLIDWCYSVGAGEPLRAISPAHADAYPPEVAARQPATPATDLFLAAYTICRLMGSPGPAEQLPPQVPAPIRALLRACQIAAPHRRPDDAWQLLDEFHAILGECYGPPTFRPFPIAA